MNGHQPKKTCSNCLHLYTCKHIKPTRQDCRSWEACLPPPPPNTGSSVQKPPKVIYICDGRACETCRSEARDCYYTEKIEHAVNFKNENGCYVEQETKTDEKEIIVDLMREIRRLKEWRFEHCKHKTGWCAGKEDCERCQFTRK